MIQTVLNKRFVMMLVALMMTIVSFAQNLTGTVKDSKGEPVIGASIQVKGSKTGVITDINGNYSIKGVKPGQTLIVTSVGYLTQNLKYDNQSSLNITLEDDNQSLDELVVVGYGTVKKRNLTSAVSKMNDKAIKDRPLARAEQALQGELAGVSVRTVSGEPGADPQIRVRGAASVNASSDPLYVVDGVPMTTISNLNPGDIQNIEVLKDAAASAIYGSRGSNGVVIVTTKKGKNGKPTVTFNASVGFQTPEKKLDLMTSEEWMAFNVKFRDASYLQQAQSLGITNASIKDDTATRLSNLGIKTGGYNYINDDRWFQYLDAETQASHTYNKDAGSLDLLDWQDNCLRNAMIQNYDVAVNGGTDKISYMVSGGYMKQDGLMVGTDYQRITLRANVESKINKYISIGMNIAPTFIKSNGSGTANGKDTYMHHVLDSSPVSDGGVGYMTNVQPNGVYNWGKSSSSPSYQSETNIAGSDKMRLVANGFLRVFPIEGLRVELSGSVDYYHQDGQTYTFTSTQSGWTAGEGAASTGGHTTSKTLGTMIQGLVNYDKSFGKHNLSLMAGISREQTNVGYSTSQQYKVFANDAITGSFDMTSSTPTTNYVTELTPNKLVSAFGRVQYNFDERYMFSASLRGDGSSVFGQDNKWGLFPAVSAGWMISSEKFWKNAMPKWWNDFKFRVSYGATGNNNITYTAAYATLASTTYGGLAGYSANSLGNADLGWEKTHSVDIAMDFGMFNNRLQFSIDYYSKTTKDLLYSVPVAGASGFTSITGNVGEISNKGVELEITSHNFTGAFKWTTSFNASYNTNNVESIGTDNTPIYSYFEGLGHSEKTSNILAVGHSINEFYMYNAIGVWKTQAEIDAFAAEHGGKTPTFQGKVIKPGDIRYDDANGDGIFTLDDQEYLGSPTPHWTFGITNTFEWKNWDASILMTAQAGGKIFGAIGRAIDRPGMGASTNMMDCWCNAWWSETEQGDGTTPYILSSTTGGTVDSRWLYSSNYFSIKNLTLGYTVPLKNKKILSRLRFYVSFENLLRFDSYYNGYSPEIANAKTSVAYPGGATALGIDYGGYPTARIYTIGANITF